MESKNWQGVLPRRSPAPFSPFPSQCDPMALPSLCWCIWSGLCWFPSLSISCEVSDPLDLLSARVWVGQWAQSSQQESASWEAVNHFLGLLSWFPFFIRSWIWGSRHPLSQEEALWAAGVYQCRVLLQVPSCPGSFVTALAHPVRWTGVELSVGNQEHPLQGHQAGSRAGVEFVLCWGEIQHSQPRSNSLLVFVYCQSVQELCWWMKISVVAGTA